MHCGTTNKQAQAAEEEESVCPAFSLHNRDVSLSRPAEAQELIHREGESAHFKKKKKREKREIRRVTVSTSVRRGDGSWLCAKQHNSSGDAVVCCSDGRRVLAYATEFAKESTWDKREEPNERTDKRRIFIATRYAATGLFRLQL